MQSVFGAMETIVPVAPSRSSPKRPFSPTDSPTLNRGMYSPPAFCATVLVQARIQMTDSETYSTCNEFRTVAMTKNGRAPDRKCHEDSGPPGAQSHWNWQTCRSPCLCCVAFEAMKHATDNALDKLDALSVVVRSHAALKEKKPGPFYRPWP